jgi:hypothetical protein
MPGRIARGAAAVLLWVLALGIAGWGALALWISGPGGPVARATFAGVAAVSVLAARIGLRPTWRAALGVLAVLGLLLVWWSGLAPSNDRDWAPDVARIPTASIHGNLVTVHNVRDFDYRSETDFTPHWEDRTYDLSKLRGMDLFLSYWGSPVIAHTILSWDFGGGQHLAISIETRKERNEQYSAIAGFFRQYELAYVAADERDLIRLRTNFRHEQVYLYHLRTPAPRARALLLDYLNSMNRLAAKPEWYNALTTNCTTTIRTHVLRIAVAFPWSWKLLLNGYLDGWLYERGVLDQSLPFPQLRAASLIDARAQAADDARDFSDRIRVGIPGGPGPPEVAPAAGKGDR